jgi:23S rRNA pseudouridine1911/1915/1917 synthase
VKRLTLRVIEGESGERLDRFIAARGGISRGVARRALEAGGVFLDGRRCKVASRAVHAGQRVEVNLEEGGRPAASPPPLDRSRLLYADAALVAVDKPPGVPAQPTLTRDRGTIAELAGALVGGGALTVVHRLDLETSGVTLLARTRDAAAALSEAFRAGSPRKTYLALTARAPSPREGRIDEPLGPDPLRRGRRIVTAAGEEAVTAYRTLREGERAALVEARPETGRTHQIRVHLAHLGAPLLGDVRYGGPRRVLEASADRVMLHARRLEIAHPDSGEPLAFEAPVPADFTALEAILIPPGTT